MYKRTFNFIMMSANPLEIHTQSNFIYGMWLKISTWIFSLYFFPLLSPSVYFNSFP